MAYSALLTQTATYWAPATADGFGGLSFAAPSAFLVRWQDATDLFQDADGEEFVSAAIVYTAAALAENGYLFLGTSAAADPLAQDAAYRIRRRQRSQSPDGSVVVHKTILG